jgi:ubiquinone/menaquinone biosynthesis C-methylase UbiE
MISFDAQKLLAVREQVRTLFNEDASCWSQMYQPHKKMAWRLDEFHHAVASHIPAPARVLDFGCGTGNLAAHLQNCGYAVTGCDIADEMIMVACHAFEKSGVEWIRLPPNWRRLPFGDGGFDAVVASSVFEYLGDCDLAFGELARVLRRGGVLIMTVPNPHHPRRKIEGLVRRLMTYQRTRSLAHCIPSIRKHLPHIELSRNHWAMDGWLKKATQHGFRNLQSSHARSFNRPLWQLSFQRDV